MAYTRDMYAGVQLAPGVVPVRHLNFARRDSTLARQPNTETSNFVEVPPANYIERFTYDKLVMCLPEVSSYRH